MTRTMTWSEGMRPLGPAVAALGVFDGVHIGHQALVCDAVALARSKDALAVVVTFDRDPDQVVTPASASPQLLELDDKLALLAGLGADVVLVMPFTSELAITAPLVFLDEVLLGSMTPLAVVVGYDFRFGHRAEGDVDVLVRYGAQRGFSVVAHELVRDDGSPVSSTRIRALVRAGDVAEAARLLGRPHRVKGEVAHGRGEGAALDAPTANLVVPPYAALPADGVYAGRTTVDGATYPAAISVGVPPSFPEATDVLEVHLAGFGGDLYGRRLTVEFLQRLRDQRRFDDPVELAAAIRSDIERVRRIAEGRRD
jgi:riboflavin kinase / FMN adenylyltransferase